LSIEEWMSNVAKELQKHADRDGCYDCKQLLKYPPVQAFVQAKEGRWSK
jgi:hypothetical protein